MRFPSPRSCSGPALLAGLLAAVSLAMLAAPRPAVAREAVLRLQDGRPFCEAYPCDVLLPDAEAFRPAAELELPVLESLKGGKVYAYLFLSLDLVSIPGYSGKPLVTLVAMDRKGLILAAKVVHHNEPILLVGIPERVLDEYLAHYVGRSILDPGLLDLPAPEAKQELKRAGAGEPLPAIYMITGATVTALVLDDTLLTSARDVGRALGLLERQARRIVTWHADYQPRTWDALLADGSIGHLRVEPQEMDEASPTGEPWIELYFGDLTQPIVGINILGEPTYNWLRETLQDGERAIFIAARGMTSFKGSGFVRGGLFDRFHLKQGLNQFTFKDLDYEHLYGIKAAGAPPLKEFGLFFLRHSRFEPTLPWQFVFLSNKLTGETATSKVFKTFSAEYALPAGYYDVQVVEAPARRTIVQKVWADQWPEALGLSLVLAGIMGVFFARRWLRASARRLEAVHLGVLAVAVVSIGLILKTPPSVTQLFPLVQTWEAGFRGDLFLADPLLFVFWIFIAASLVLWGRGWFCGWVCPYGALLELVYAVSKRVLPRRWRRLNFPPRVHNVLRRVRYVVLFALIAISVVSLEWAERLAEVEPFKTTWLVGVFHREWYLVLYWWMLLAASVFIFRFFCRYVCPLGAALSIGTALRLIGIRRKEFCTRCKLCARGCDSLAIDAQGRINKYECLYCMECEQKYYDDRVCPPLAIARRQRERLERQQAAAGAPPPPPVLPGPGDLREPAP
jgi:NosR/NirI family nitrous oxide reductase transcriptional regulator